MSTASTLKREKPRDEYIDSLGYWIDPQRNIRRMGEKDGEQIVILKATPECSDAEWDRFYEAIVACVNLPKK